MKWGLLMRTACVLSFWAHWTYIICIYTYTTTERCRTNQKAALLRPPIRRHRLNWMVFLNQFVFSHSMAKLNLCNSTELVYIIELLDQRPRGLLFLRDSFRQNGESHTFIKRLGGEIRSQNRPQVCLADMHSYKCMVLFSHHVIVGGTQSAK